MLQDRRLIKRYCSTNPVFLALFLRDFIMVNLRRMVRGAKTELAIHPENLK